MKNENEAVTKVSLRVAHLLAKEGKPFTDGELIKSCLIVAAEEMCPENVDLFKSISLSARTVARRVEEIGDSKKQLLFSLVELYFKQLCIITLHFVK